MRNSVPTTTGRASVQGECDRDAVAELCLQFSRAFSLAMMGTGTLPVLIGIFSLVLPFGNTVLKPMTVITNLAMLDMDNPTVNCLMAVLHLVNIASPLCVAVFLFLNRPPWECRKRLPFRSMKPSHRPVTGPLMVWAAAIGVLTVTVVVEFFLNATAFFQVQRLAFCFLIFFFNTIMILCVKSISAWVEKEPSKIVKDGLLFDIHIFLVVVNTLAAISLKPLQVQMGFLTLPMSPPYKMVLMGTAAEGFAFLWLSFLISQGLKFISDFFESLSRGESKLGKMLKSNPVLSVIFVKTNPKELYGSRELYTLKLLVVSYVQTIGLLNPWIGVLAVACIVGSVPLAMLRQRLFFPDYKGEMSLVPWRMPLVFGWLPLTSLAWVWIFLTPLGRDWVMINTIATVTWIVGAAHFYLVWRSETSAERGEESRLRSVVIPKSKRASVTGESMRFQGGLGVPPSTAGRAVQGSVVSMMSPVMTAEEGMRRDGEAEGRVGDDLEKGVKVKGEPEGYLVEEEVGAVPNDMGEEEGGIDFDCDVPDDNEEEGARLPM
mmetsp:Transcript_211/g.514  ORF Transcript_211/g.514 Transcript_211/m.514 type:complete len:546 (-) Transcript_211:104-1741(-)